MEIKYCSKMISQNIDVSKLRPNKSYDFLIENRNSSLAELLKDKDLLQHFLRLRTCPLCDGANYTVTIEKDNLDIVTCNDCSVVYVNPIFDEKKYQDIYRSAEYQHIVKQLGEQSHNYRVQRFGNERASFIDKWHDSSLPKTFLDVGCSTGFTVEALSGYGWDAKGLELNPSAVAFAKARGLKVENKSVEDLGDGDMFSAIALFDVLEHLVNPREIIIKLKRQLHHGGNLFVYVPNWNSASRELLGEENCHFIWPTHHLTYFTPLTLKRFFEDLGFEILFWETQGLDLIDFQWFLAQKMDVDVSVFNKFSEQLQFYINASGHGKNLRMYARKIGD